MNRYPMRHFYLAIAFVFLSGLNTLAQPLQLDEFSTLAVQITSNDSAPFTLPIYKDREFETTWSGDIPRTPTQPTDANNKGLNIPIKVRKEGDVVRIDVSVGLESFKEVALGTYYLKLDESVLIREVTQYGFKPFVFKLIRMKTGPPLVVPPLLGLPDIENRLKSIEVVGLEKGESADEYLLSLRNNGPKNVIDLEINMPTGGTTHEWGSLERPLILAAAIYKISISAQTVGRKTEAGFEPNPVQPRGVINAALFDDGTYEGDFVSAATMEARRRGRELQLRRIIELLEKALGSEDQASVTTLERIKEDVYSLGVDSDADTIEDIRRHYPPLNERLQYVVQGIKDQMSAWKYDLIHELKTYEDGKHSADGDDLRDWLQRTKEHFKKLSNAH